MDTRVVRNRRAVYLDKDSHAAMNRVWADNRRAGLEPPTISHTHYAYKHRSGWEKTKTNRCAFLLGVYSGDQALPTPSTKNRFHFNMTITDGACAGRGWLCDAWGNVWKPRDGMLIKPLMDLSGGSACGHEGGFVRRFLDDGVIYDVHSYYYMAKHDIFVMASSTRVTE